jgi:serine/threonine-protein kinase RsbW
MKHELKLYCEKSRSVGVKGISFRRILNDSKLSEITKNQLILAVEEVCANLIIHSHGCNPKNSILLSVNFESKKLIFEITDSGKAFNIIDHESPDIQTVIKEKRKGGLGLLLVRKIMDEIEFETNSTHNTCRLIKKLNSK